MDDTRGATVEKFSGEFHGGTGAAENFMEKFATATILTYVLLHACVAYSTKGNPVTKDEDDDAERDPGSAPKLYFFSDDAGGDGDGDDDAQVANLARDAREAILEEQYKCLDPRVSYEHSQTPMFVVQLLDSQSLAGAYAKNTTLAETSRAAWTNCMETSTAACSDSANRTSSGKTDHAHGPLQMPGKHCRDNAVCVGTKRHEAFWGEGGQGGRKGKRKSNQRHKIHPTLNPTRPPINVTQPAWSPNPRGES